MSEKGHVYGMKLLTELKSGTFKKECRPNHANDFTGGFLRIKGLDSEVLISSDILNHVVVDYFVDIDRLKEFQNIEKAHESKIYAYLAFWLLRHKPLQLKNTENAEKLAFINEEFVGQLVRSYLFTQPENCPILNNQRDTVDNFVETATTYPKRIDSCYFYLQPNSIICCPTYTIQELHSFFVLIIK